MANEIDVPEPQDGDSAQEVDDKLNALEAKFQHMPMTDRDWTTRLAIDHDQLVFVAGVTHKEDQPTP